MRRAARAGLDVWGSSGAGRLLWGPLRALGQLVYPPLCLACDADLEQPEPAFCRACLSEMVSEAPACLRCAATVGPYTDRSRGCPECRGRGHRFDEAIHLGPYSGRLRAVCLALKSSTGVHLSPALAKLLCSCRSQALKTVDADMVVAVPLHFVRRFQRGFNQAESLARHIARELKISHRSRILKRVRRTLPQSQLSREQRGENVRGAFHALRTSDLQEATVLLVDDILTTGATCSVAARALKQAGASRVVVAVVARSQEHASA